MILGCFPYSTELKHAMTSSTATAVALATTVYIDYTFHFFLYPTAQVYPLGTMVPYPRDMRNIWSQTVRETTRNK